MKLRGAKEIEAGPELFEEVAVESVAVVFGPPLDSADISYAIVTGEANEQSEDDEVIVFYLLSPGLGCPTVECARILESAESVVIQLLEKPGEPGLGCDKAFNNCTNQTLYNQTQYGGPSAEFFGTATPYVGDTYADEVLSVHLRTRCTTYSPSNNNVCDWIRQNYESNGGPNGFLGAPTSNQITNTDNVGARQTFANTGAIYYAPATGAHAVQGSILTKYNQLGAEGGTLGYPTRDNTKASDK